jgi:hypothetical protein
MKLTLSGDVNVPYKLAMKVCALVSRCLPLQVAKWPVS